MLLQSNHIFESLTDFCEMNISELGDIINICSINLANGQPFKFWTITFRT